MATVTVVSIDRAAGINNTVVFFAMFVIIRTNMPVGI